LSRKKRCKSSQKILVVDGEELVGALFAGNGDTMSCKAAKGAKGDHITK
jgi:hypothetical protein